MTIKQQGGIFGRNPSFNNVDVVDLTVSNNLTVSNDLSVADDLSVAGQLTVTGGASAAPSYSFVGDTDTGISRPTGDSVNIVGGGNEIARFNTSGIDLKYGSLKVINGQGIDFSATSDGSGTTTSELFDDYEEGTWTGTLIGVTTAGASPTATGNYTKVGNRVHVGIDFSAVDTTGATGNIRVTGLPFTSTSVSIGTCYNSRGPASTTIANMPTANTFINQINYAGSSQNWATSGTTYAGYVVTYKA
jgi:hypothetical protein